MAAPASLARVAQGAAAKRRRLCRGGRRRALLATLRRTAARKPAVPASARRRRAASAGAAGCCSAGAAAADASSAAKRPRRQEKAEEAAAPSTAEAAPETATSAAARKTLSKEDSARELDRRPANGEEAGGVTVVLFYQYKEPPWSPEEHKKMIAWAEESGKRYKLGGRMRVAREGFNCTLTGRFGQTGVRGWCRELRETFPDPFAETEFKLTDGLPQKMAWSNLEVQHCEELVGYGLAGSRAPPLKSGGVHLEPSEYHAKLSEPGTVVIDVRNGYEADVGRFVPGPGVQFINPDMRRSTDWPAWLSKPETQERLQGKQVLMYCTGGIRCERASSLLKLQMGDQVNGVFQLQGGIDKYLKEYSEDGGHWVGKNYTFDKRAMHGAGDAPATEVLGRCILCQCPFEDYKHGARCKTCGVPTLVCDTCAASTRASRFDPVGGAATALGDVGQCPLCAKEGVKSKAELKDRERRQNAMAGSKVDALLASKGLAAAPGGAIAAKGNSGASSSGGASGAPANPDGVTRLFIGNLSAKRVDESMLLETFPGITHIQWLRDRDSGLFYGSVFVEMATPEDAARAVALDGSEIAMRKVKVRYSPLEGPGRWPPLGTAVGSCAKPPTAADAKSAAAKGGVAPMGAKPFPKCRKFFVRGVSKDATDADVRAFFAKAGSCRVVACRWMTRKETGEFRGCGHVELATTNEADIAASMHGQKLLGQAIRLEWAV
eukprot:TRINITY_DN26019_c0_g3_i1.p1 TRINITY_DN26019_c0_g3~~TRINITY_DN26019_c0_g3_i1.p1  ORF type:complete len:720 (-),score=176.79 TRINITY_DN26019_c0_g3_i1:76-2235(-)